MDAVIIIRYCNLWIVTTIDGVRCLKTAISLKGYQAMKEITGPFHEEKLNRLSLPTLH